MKLKYLLSLVVIVFVDAPLCFAGSIEGKVLCGKSVVYV
jgi:hypothetical protein